MVANCGTAPGSKRWRGRTPLAWFVAAEIGRRRRCESIGASPEREWPRRRSVPTPRRAASIRPHRQWQPATRPAWRSGRPLAPGTWRAESRRRPERPRPASKRLGARRPERESVVPAFDAVHRIEHRRRNERRIATPDLGIAPSLARATSMCSCQSVTSSARTAPAMASGSTRTSRPRPKR